MSAVHGLLSKLPDSLNYEQLIRVAVALFERHPPKQVAKKGRLKMSNRSVLEGRNDLGVSIVSKGVCFL